MMILLVRPKPHQDSIGLQKFMICEPLELEYLGAAVAGRGHEVVILDMILEKKPLLHFLEKYQPDVVAFTAYISHTAVVRNYAASVKRWKSDCVTVTGGVHAEVNGADFQMPAIDHVLDNNGMLAFRELIISLENGQVYSPQKIQTSCNGSDLRIDGKPVFPDRNLTRRYRGQYNYVFHNRCATLKTSYGCAYQCEFCYCSEITGRRYSERDMAEVIEELKTIEEKNVFIVDDNFLFREERLEQFITLMRANGISKNFILFGRADFIASHDELMGKLAENGLTAVFVGIESFRDEELQNMNKRTSVEMNLKAVRILEKHNIECYSGIIVGMDWEKKDFRTLANWLNSFQWPVVNIQPITPMPGTRLYQKLQDRITVPRERYELWDMAHLVMQPEKMSRRMYYFQIMKTYLTSSVSISASVSLIKKYGFGIYFRVLKGVIFIFGQYVRLVLNG